MAEDRFKVRVAVLAIIQMDNKVLLQKRINTGYMDGFYDLGAAGHLESGESLEMAMQREIKEELGVIVKLENINFVSIVHKKDGESGLEYMYVYFKIKNFTDKPSIMEPNKNAALQWFDLNDLPANLISDRQTVLNNLTNDSFYDEFGWNL